MNDPSDGDVPARPIVGKRARKKTLGLGRPKKKSSKQRIAIAKIAGQRRAIENSADAGQRTALLSQLDRTIYPKSLLDREAAAHAKRWIEYRYLTPFEADERLAAEYIKAYRRIGAEHTKDALAAKRQPIKDELAANSIAEMVSIRKARLLADELGMPYDLFLDLLMRGNVIGDKWRGLPRPNQLLSSRQTRARLRGRPTRQDVADRLFGTDWDPRFFAARPAEDPVRAAAMQELRVDVLRADDKAGRLAKYLGVGGLLPVARARTMFDDELLNAALALHPMINRPGPDFDEPQFVPACIGNRNTQTWRSPCKSCPWTNQCQTLETTVTQALIRTTGSADPVTARRRQADRERKRKQRRLAKQDGPSGGPELGDGG